MEFTRMGFDLSVMVLVALGNCTLIAIGAGLAAYFRRVIKRWEEEEAAGAFLSTDSNDYSHTHVMEVPASLGHLQESHQSCFGPVIVDPPAKAFA